MDFLKNDNGQDSFARLAGCACILMYLVWATYITFSTKVIADVPLQLAGLVSLLYGIGKLGTKNDTPQ